MLLLLRAPRNSLGTACARLQYYYYQLYTSRAKFDYASGDYVHGAQDHARALNYLARAKAEKKALG